MIGFAKRNIKLFFRDKSAVFFSLLAVFIIIGLYALFLGDVWTSSLSELGESAEVLMSSWIMAGLLAVTSVTTTMGAFGIMVDDRIKKIDKDFYSSPLKRSSIAGGYVISSFVIGVIMSVVTFVLAELYILFNGGSLLGVIGCLKVMGLILLTTFMNTALLLLLVSFFRSQNAFATASTVIGTLIGFLTGIYLPVGSLPEGVRIVVKVFPVSHAAALFRQVLMEQPLQEAFSSVPGEAAASFKEQMGISFRFGDFSITPLISILILAATAVLFFALSVLRIAKARK